MGYRLPSNCLKSNGLLSFRSILLPHFFFCSSTTAVPISSSEELNSLTNWFVTCLGFSQKQAFATSTKLTHLRQSKSPGAKQVCNPNLLRNADLVLNFLQQKGLQKPQIGNLVSSAPKILACRIEQNLEPKMRGFQQLGFSVSDFAGVISAQPGLLGDGLDSTIRPAIEQLRAIMGSNENVVRVIKGMRLNMLHMVTTTLVPNVSALRDQGIPIESIQKRIVNLPTTFMRNPEDFRKIMAQAETKWGVLPGSTMFLYAVHVLSCLNERTIESKCGVYESFGWDRSNVVDLFRRNPLHFCMSDGNIRDKLDFFMDKLGYDPGYLLAHHILLCYSLEKRVVPRNLVFQLLKEKGLVRGDRSFYSVVSIAESQFLTRFVRPFEKDVPGLYQMYVNSINSSSQRQSRREKSIPFPGNKLKHV